METKKAIGERILKIRTENNLSQDAFGNLLGMGKAGISAIENGKNYPSIDSVVTLSELYSLNVNWLLTGKGDRIIIKGEGGTGKSTSAATKGDFKILPITVDEHGEENIVMVDTLAQAGYPSLYLIPEFYKDLATLKIPSTVYRNGTFRAFEVVNDSMVPTLHPKSIVISRYEDNWEKGNISEGYIYVIVTQKEVLVKRVLNRLDRDELYLMSDNEYVEGFSVHKDEVQQLWRVVGGIINKFPNTRFEWRKKMSHMEADIFDLKKEIQEMRKKLK